MPTIHEAAQRGDAEALGRELASGVSPNALDSAGWTPLHNLCYNGRDNAEARVACVRMLIDAGADIHATTVGQTTSLHLAATFSHADVVAALIKAGADVNRGDPDNRTPLHSACWRNDSDVEPAWVLIKNGADINARDCVGETPLDRRPWTRRLVPILLRAGATPPAQTTNAYIQKVIAAGGFRIYERTHLATLTATVKSKLGLPARPARRVAEYAFHVGDY